MLAQHGDFSGDFIGVELCRAGYAFERNVVNKATGVSGDGLHPRFAGGGGDEENVVDVALREGGLQRGDGFDGVVHGEHAVYACFGGGLGKGFVAHFVHGVQIAHQHHGGLRVALAELFDRCQHVAQGNVLREGAFHGALDGGAVCHRVGKGNAEFDDVCAVFRHAVHHGKGGGEIGVACGDVGNQGFLAAQLGEGGGDAAHGGAFCEWEKADYSSLKRGNARGRAFRLPARQRGVMMRALQ